MRLMATQIMQKEGIAGFYRGFIPSAVKNLPNKGFYTILLRNGIDLRPFCMESQMLIPTKLSHVRIKQFSVQASQLILCASTRDLSYAGLRLAIFDGAKRILSTSQAALEEEQRTYRRNKLQMIKCQ